MDFMAIFENDKKRVADKLTLNPEYFDALSEGQKPEFLYTECSDSRVTAKDLMGVNPGEDYLHRNAANMVASTDNNVNAVVKYAAEQLHVKHIFVCGRYGCGGINAALHPSDLGHLNSWVQNIRDVYRIDKAEIDGISDQQKQFDRLMELNVREQCINLFKSTTRRNRGMVMATPRSTVGFLIYVPEYRRPKTQYAKGIFRC